MRKLLIAAAIAAGLTTLGQPVQAADWPTKPIEMIGQGAPGGSSDNVWRAIAESVVKTLGQQINNTYKPGSGGNIACEYASHQAPDGYTFVIVTIASQGIGPHLYKNLKYDPINDLTHVARMTTLPNLLYANKDFPANSVQELIAYAKANPGKVDYASSGAGTSPHMSAVLFSQQAKVEMSHIPYKASAPAVQGVMTGEANISFENLSAVMPQAIAKTVKPLAITSAQRWPKLPDVPTVAESGLPGFDVSSWFGISAPKGTPKEIVDKFSKAVQQALADPAVIERIRTLGAEPAYQNSVNFTAFINAESARWKPIVELSGASAE